MGAAGTEAVVGKPSEKEPAGGVRRRCCARYGDFGTVPADVAAADVARGVIVRRRGAGDAARDARERELDADLSFAGLAGWRLGRVRPRPGLDRRDRLALQRWVRLAAIMTYRS